MATDTVSGFVDAADLSPVGAARCPRSPLRLKVPPSPSTAASNRCNSPCFLGELARSSLGVWLSLPIS